MAVKGVKKTTKKTEEIKPEEAVEKAQPKQAKIPRVPCELETCAILLTSRGKFDKAKRTAEGIRDKAVREEVLKHIENIEKA